MKVRIKRVYDWAGFVEAFHYHVTCRVFGHKMTLQKMSGKLCARCRLFERTQWNDNY